MPALHNTRPLRPVCEVSDFLPLTRPTQSGVVHAGGDGGSEWQCSPMTRDASNEEIRYVEVTVWVLMVKDTTMISKHTQIVRSLWYYWGLDGGSLQGLFHETTQNISNPLLMYTD